MHPEVVVLMMTLLTQFCSRNDYCYAWAEGGRVGEIKLNLLRAITEDCLDAGGEGEMWMMI